MRKRKRVPIVNINVSWETFCNKIIEVDNDVQEFYNTRHINRAKRLSSDILFLIDLLDEMREGLDDFVFINKRGEDVTKRLSLARRVKPRKNS